MDRDRILAALPLQGVPLPGSGHTAERHRILFELGRRDLSLARMLEAHTDAVAILAEAGRVPTAGTLYGVWASDGPQSQLVAEPDDGAWRLSGVKQYCSGATTCTAALVTARHCDEVLLFRVALDAAGVEVLPTTWATPAFAETHTGPVSFTQVRATNDDLVGSPHWYLQRAGFWHGAIGPAACWAGGAASLVDAATALNRQDPHSRAQVGALQAIAWGIEAVLDTAGRQIDRDPLDTQHDARVRALKLRHLIERWCTEVIDRFGRATGPQLLAYNAHIAHQHMALTLYIRQCHAERDSANIPATA